MIEGAVKDGAGKIVLQAQQFMSLVGGLETAATFAVSDTDKITMQSSGWKVKLPTIEAALHSPVLTEPNYTITLRIEPLVHAIEAASSPPARASSWVRCGQCHIRLRQPRQATAGIGGR